MTAVIAGARSVGIGSTLVIVGLGLFTLSVLRNAKASDATGSAAV